MLKFDFNKPRVHTNDYKCSMYVKCMTEAGGFCKFYSHLALNLTYNVSNSTNAIKYPHHVGNLYPNIGGIVHGRDQTCPPMQS